MPNAYVPARCLASAKRTLKKCSDAGLNEDAFFKTLPKQVMQVVFASGVLEEVKEAEIHYES
ncbi:MAG: hypothetical protein ACI8Z5_000315 [Lentimonas sp.]|jgi:hypothetical protein